MSIAQSEMTAEQLLSESSTRRCQFIEGKLIEMSSTGWEHGIRSMSSGAKFFAFVSSKKMGPSFAAETGCFIARDPDTVQAPDAAFVRTKRWEAVDQSVNFLPRAPDFVAEVMFQSDSHEDVPAKVHQRQDSGTTVVGMLELNSGKTSGKGPVYESRDLIRVLEVSEKLTCENLLPGFEVNVGDLFPMN